MAGKITAKTLAVAIAELAAGDKKFAELYERHGAPPLRARPAGFATMLKIICAQQVSTASARAIVGRLQEAADPLTPATYLALNEASLKTIGFSRMKATYGRGLAETILAGSLDLGAVASMDDEAAIAELVRVKGIGRWSAEIYLLFALRRPDLWPVGDLAVVKGVQRLKGLAERPRPDAMMAYGEAWRPWRSVAARMLWHCDGNTPPDS